jgi:signal transduction histidine kinase
MTPDWTNLIDLMPFGVYILDKDFQVVQANRTIQNMFHHVDFSKLPFCYFGFFGHQDYCQDCPCKQGMLDGKTQQFTKHNLGPFQNISVHVTAIPIQGVSGANENIMVIYEDISESVHLNDSMQKAFRVLTSSSLASLVSHEMNQPLNSLLLSASSLKMYVEKEPVLEPATIAKYADRIEKLSERMAGTVEQLRRHGTWSEEQPSASSPSHAIDDATSIFAERMTSARITLIKKLPPELPLIWASPADLEMSLASIMTNAIQSLENQYKVGRNITIEATTTSEILAISIRDTGVGFGANLGRALEPFFTTRDRGMGLGLAIVQSTLRAWGAEIMLADHPQGGAIVRLIFRLFQDRSKP